MHDVRSMSKRNIHHGCDRDEFDATFRCAKCDTDLCFGWEVVPM